MIGTDLSASALERAAILGATVEVVAERGYADASLGVVLARAGVSREVFHRLFADFEGCFVAVLDEGTELLVATMDAAFARERDWLDGLRAAEAAVLVQLDCEPSLARVLVVETLAAGAGVLERRARNVEAMRAMILEHLRDAPPGVSERPLAAEGIMASLIGVLHDHLVREDPAPLISLLGPLMGIIAGPYLDPDGVTREIHRGDALARSIQAGTVQVPPASRVTSLTARLPQALHDPRAHRARNALLYLAIHPGASNRQVGAGVGVGGHAQASALLTRLQRMGLVVNHPGDPGRANAWRLTATGQEAAFLLHDDPTPIENPRIWADESDVAP
jgi:AcrR family transcriptional regulator